MVSIIVPIYNMENYLEKCLDSLVGQTECDIEIILVNDGSTDSSAEICEKYSQMDSRIRIITKANEGLGMARNTGLEAATGEYISFVDSDDWLEIDFVREIVFAMERDNADIGLCDINYVDSSTMKSSLSKIRMKNGINVVHEDRSLINKARTFAWGKIYRKTLFFDHNVRYPSITFEDIPCTSILIALADRVTYVPKALCNYRRNRENSLSVNTSNIGDIYNSLLIMKQNFANAKILDKFQIELKKIYIGQMRFAANRWGNINEAGVKEKLNKLIDDVVMLHDDLILFPNMKFYANGDYALEEALNRVIIWKNQLSDSSDIMAVEITYTDNPKRINQIRVQRNCGFENEEEQIWDYAEQIMEKIKSGLKDMEKK